MRRFRRALGVVLVVALIVLDLALATWLLRDVWLIPLARRELESTLSSALGMEVGIRGIRGNLVRTVGIDGVELKATDASSVIDAVEAADITVGLDPVRVLRGHLDGIRSVRATARRVAVRLPAAEPATDPATATDPWDLASGIVESLDLLPDGAVVTVDWLSLRGPDGALIGEGPARVVLSPKPRRRILLDWGGVLTVEALLTADGMFHVDVEVADLPARLFALGVDVPLDSGGGLIEVEGDLDTRELRGTVSWTGGSLRDHGASSVAATVHIRHDAVQIDADAEGPGGRVIVRDLGIPFADLDDTIRAARGSLDVEIRDLEPWRSWLPDAVTAELPITGTIRATMSADGLSVRRGALVGRRASVEIFGGRLPLGARDARPASLRARIDASEPFVLDLDGEPIRFRGGADLALSGSLLAPEVEAVLGLGPGSAYGQSWDALRARVNLADGVMRVRDLVALGVRAEDGEATADLEGTVTVRLPDAARSSLLLDLDVAGRGAPASWLDSVAPRVDPGRTMREAVVAVVGSVEFGDGRYPVGHAKVVVESLTMTSASAPMAGSIDLRVAPPESAPDEPQRFELRFDGTLDSALVRLLDSPPPAAREIDSQALVQVTLSGLLASDGATDLGAILHVAELRIGGADALELDAAVRMPRPTLVVVDQLSICGPATWNAHGTIPLTVDDGAISFVADGTVQDSGELAAWLPGIPAQGRAHLRLAISGPAHAPDLSADVELHAEDAAALIERLWPAEVGTAPTGPIDLGALVHVRSGEVIVEQLALTIGSTDHGAALLATGRAPLRVALDGVTPGSGLLRGHVAVRATAAAGPGYGLATPFSWTNAAFRLDHVVVTTPVSDVEGAFAVLEPGRVLTGSSPSELEVTGTLGLRHLDTAGLPPGTVPPEILTGFIDGALALGGTLGAPTVAGTLAVHGGRVKLTNDVPIIDRIEALVHVDTHAVVIEHLTGRLGIGTLKIEGRIETAPDIPLFAAPERARIELDIVAEDALVVRSTGRKLRADARLSVRGDLAKLLVEGDVAVTNGRFVRRISLVPDFATRGGAAVGSGIELFEIPPPFGDALHFDIRVRTVGDIDVLTHVLDTRLSASIALRGTGAAPRLEGAVAARSGTLRLPAVSLAISQILATFTPDDPKHPQLLLRASAQRHGIDVSLTANGRIDAPEILLSSLPPLTQQELLLLVSTGVLPDTLQKQGLAGRATMVGSYLAEEIYDFYFGSDSTESRESIVDRFHFYSGREISRNGVESIVIDVDVAGGFGLEGERDVYEDYNMGILYRIRF